jgi:hypothetical protein
MLDDGLQHRRFRQGGRKILLGHQEQPLFFCAAPLFGKQLSVLKGQGRLTRKSRQSLGVPRPVIVRLALV